MLVDDKSPTEELTLTCDESVARCVKQIGQDRLVTLTGKLALVATNSRVISVVFLLQVLFR